MKRILLTFLLLLSLVSGLGFAAFQNTTQANHTASVASLTLINADTDQPVITMSDGMTINIAVIPNLNIRANVTTGTIGSVLFEHDDEGSVTINKTENTAPYAFMGDTNGN